MRVCIVIALAGLIACPAQSQTAPDPKADLAVIEARAGQDPETTLLLESIRQNISRTGRTPVEVLTRYFGRADGLLRDGKPFAYRLESQRRTAQMRAQLVGQILQADLDGDWQVARSELAQVLQADPGGNIADVFIVGDVDGNNILDFAEMQRAVAAMSDGRARSYGQDDLALRLFDLDDDGVLTTDESLRSIEALAQ